MATATKKAAETVEPSVIPEVTGYETDLRFFATRYKQGGRTVYALDLSPDQIRALVAAPDPNVHTPGNRAIRPQHAADFGRYFRDNEKWVAPAIILHAPNTFQFEVLHEVGGVEFGVLSFPRAQASDIRILDGQHRILGFHLADRGIATDLDKARSQLASARRQDPGGALVAEAQRRIAELDAQRKRLATERISLQIFVEEDLGAYKQMFFDIADNALGITASVKARFDTRKVVNRALESVLEHPLLQNRVDFERDRATGQYVFGAKHVAEIVRTIQVGLDGRVSRLQDKSWSETEIAKKAKVFLDLVVRDFPSLQALTLGQITPDDLRKTSLLGSVLMLRVLAGAYYELKEHHAFDDELVSKFFKKLAPHMGGPVYPGSIWMEHVDPSVFGDRGMAPRGRRQDLKLLKNTLVDWAIERPKWLDKAPAPRPVEPEPEGDPLEGAGYRDNPLEELAKFEDK